MMNCSDDLVQLYVEGDLQPAEAAIIEEHLKTCEACRRRFGLYKGLFWDLGQAAKLAPSEGMLDPDALATMLQEEWQRGRRGEHVRPAAMAVLWLTANPAARRVGLASVSGLEKAVSVGGAALGRFGRWLLGKKGGGRR